MAATAAMAPPADARALRKRLVSAAILLPLALVNVWLGDPYWGALVCLFALVMAWEWARMCIGPAGSLPLGLDPAGLLGMAALGIQLLSEALGGRPVLALDALLDLGHPLGELLPFEPAGRLGFLDEAKLVEQEVDRLIPDR